MAIVDKGLHNGKAPLLMEREPDTEDQDEFEVNFLSNNIRTVKSPSTCTQCLFYWTCVKHALIAGVVKPWQIERSRQESGPCCILNVEE